MGRILLLFVLFACSSKEKIEPLPSPVVEDEKAKWITYEGIIKTKFGEGPVELSLMQNEVGLESRFELKGSLMETEMFSFVRGQYTILHGAPGQEIIIQAHGRMMVFSPSTLKKMNEYLKKHKETKENRFKGGKEFKHENIEFELFFKSDGAQKLVLIDEDFNPLAEDSRYTLYKRSRLFTAEGYITFEERRTEFFEENTSGRWNVASLGVYRDVQKSYDSIATENFEGVYLKALAYSVESDSSDEELMVIKRILEMKKSDAYTNKEKATPLGYYLPNRIP